MAYSVTVLDRAGAIHIVHWSEAIGLHGSAPIVEAVRALARSLDGVDTGPICGPYTTTTAGHLQSGLTVFTMLDTLYHPILDTSGDAPERPPIPEGAIA